MQDANKTVNFRFNFKAIVRHSFIWVLYWFVIWKCRICIRNLFFALFFKFSAGNGFTAIVSDCEHHQMRHNVVHCTHGPWMNEWSEPTKSLQLFWENSRYPWVNHNLVPSCISHWFECIPYIFSHLIKYFLKLDCFTF